MRTFGKKNLFALVLFLLAVCLIAEPLFIKRPAYKDIGNYGLLDIQSGLIWARCSAGQVSVQKLCAKSKKALAWHDAKNYCKSLQRGNQKWRLPNQKEIKTLIDLNRQTPPFINIDYFSISNRAEYWTSDSIIEKTGVHFFYINFADAMIYSALANKKLFAICVTNKLH